MVCAVTHLSCLTARFDARFINVWSLRWTLSWVSDPLKGPTVSLAKSKLLFSSTVAKFQIPASLVFPGGYLTPGYTACSLGSSICTINKLTRWFMWMCGVYPHNFLIFAANVKFHKPFHFGDESTGCFKSLEL